MKKTFNSLKQYIYENSEKQYHEKTITGLFRAITAPVIENQNVTSLILLRLGDLKGKESIIKRLIFSGAEIFSYTDLIDGVENKIKDEIWDKSEFAIILSQRYSAVLLWDYETGELPKYSEMCLFCNSSKINDILKIIADNTKGDLKEEIAKYSIDRRENKLLNISIKQIANMLDNSNDEGLKKEAEKLNLEGLGDETIKTAKIVEQKAKFTAHEIKNNLSIINLYTRIIEKRIENIEFESETENSIKGALNNVKKASENVSYLINNLRCMSSPNIVETDIKQVIEQSINLCQEKAQNAKVKINTAQLPKILVNADKTHIECAITNIIFNAIEACKAGCEINITAKANGGGAKIFISNNGEKIPDDITDKIFNLDFTTKEQGNGAGLYICKTQLQRTGSDIELVHSTENETLFVITIK